MYERAPELNVKITQQLHSITHCLNQSPRLQIKPYKISKPSLNYWGKKRRGQEQRMGETKSTIISHAQTTCLDTSKANNEQQYSLTSSGWSLDSLVLIDLLLHFSIRPCVYHCDSMTGVSCLEEPSGNWVWSKWACSSGFMGVTERWLWGGESCFTGCSSSYLFLQGPRWKDGGKWWYRG